MNNNNNSSNNDSEITVSDINNLHSLQHQRSNQRLRIKIDPTITNVSDIDTEDFKKKMIDQKKNELFSLYSRSHLSKLKNNTLIEYK